MKILVSGGTTFVSKFTAEYFLKRNNEVYVINRNSREQVLGVHLIESDRMNPSNLLKNEHFDLIIDVTAYNQEHIKSIKSRITTGFRAVVGLTMNSPQPTTNPPRKACQERGIVSMRCCSYSGALFRGRLPPCRA